MTEEIKKNFLSIASDGIVTPIEIDAFVNLINSHEDAIQRVKVECDEKIAKTVAAAVTMVLGISLSMGGLVVVILLASGVPITEMWWQILTFVFAFLQTLAALKARGWINTNFIDFNHFANIVKSLFVKAKKPVPDTTPITDAIPENPPA